MKKILIVGANSFLSQSIIQKLKKNNKVIGVYNDRTNSLDKEISYIHISEINKLDDDFDVVFFISAYIPGKSENVDNKHLHDVNVKLAEQVCRQFRKAKIVYASTVSVYGDQQGTLKEGSQGKNVSKYGYSKIEGEEVVKRSARHSIVRISSMYGVGMNVSTFLPQIIISALKNNHITLFGRGERLQNYIHVDDVSEIFIRASGQDKNNTYLAVGQQSFTNSEMSEMVSSVLTETEIKYSGEDRSISYIYDASFTYKSLNYTPLKNIQAGIQELIEWQQKMF